MKPTPDHIEEIERAEKRQAAADSEAPPMENATPGTLRRATSLERFGAGVWLVDGELQRVLKALSRYAATRAHSLAREQEREADQ